jgi:hypothetical protein
MEDDISGPDRRMSRQKSTDEGRLAELGYKQELKRDWSLMHNFGVSFSIIVCYTPSLPTPTLSPAMFRSRGEKKSCF